MQTVISQVIDKLAEAGKLAQSLPAETASRLRVKFNFIDSIETLKNTGKELEHIFQ